MAEVLTDDSDEYNTWRLSVRVVETVVESVFVTHTFSPRGCE